jgi:hypothetical protein
MMGIYIAGDVVIVGNMSSAEYATDVGRYGPKPGGGMRTDAIVIGY